MALEAILAQKRALVAARKAALPEARLRAGLGRSDRDFGRALRAGGPAFILEVKPASPSEGHLRGEDELEPVIAAYGARADVVSVLTDRPFFGGSFELLRRVRDRISQPVLCKDFIIDPYQVYEARAHGADAVLLMLSVLDDETYRRAAAAAEALAMGTLTEVHSAGEMARAGALGAPVIGINNRNLATLDVDLDTTPELVPLAPPAALLIAESGIRSHRDVRRLRDSVDGFLVGTALMRAADPDRAARRLVFGPTKVCGLTRPEDAAAAARAGATHGGIIFAPESPRAVTTARAVDLVRAAPLAWVGVFADQPADYVARTAATLGLEAIQLHGDESDDYGAQLRSLLPPECAIWRARRVAGDPIAEPSGPVDAILLDAYAPGRRGGTGRTFDWSLLDSIVAPERFILSGGLSPDNVGRANRTPIEFLDVNSGVESAPGIKDRDRLARFFAGRRAASGDVS
jgi:indole-3-glycerol phosphate synthase/phosphoribosylanthranilate isomerase